MSYISYWNNKSTSWGAIQAPLKPSDEEVGAYHWLVKKYAQNASCGLLLGATPALYTLLDDLLVVDFSLEMLALKPPKKFIIDDWLNLAYKDEFDVIVGDGILTVVEDYKALLSKVYDMLKPNGLFIVRIFIKGHDINQISDDLDIERFRKYLLNLDKNRKVEVSPDVFYSFPTLSDVVTNSKMNLIYNCCPSYKFGDRFLTVCLRKPS